MLTSARKTAIKAARLDRPVHGRRAVLGAQSALAEIALAISGRGSAGEVAQVVVDEVRRVVPSDRCTVWRWLPDRDAVQLLATAAGPGTVGLAPGEVVPLASATYRRVLETGRPLREAELDHHQTALERLLAADGLHARLTVPVLVSGRAVGVLSTASRQPAVYTGSHERLLEQLAIHLGIGLEQARLTEEARRHEARLLGLQRVAQRLAASVAGDDVLDLVLEEAVRSVGGDTGTLLMWDVARQALRPVRSTVPTADGCTELRPGEGVAGRAVQRMQVTVLHDYQREPGDETPAGKAGVRAAIGAPLIADGRLLGAVTANTYDASKRFDEADVQVFELYAGQAAAIVTSVHLFESERRQRRGAEEAARAASTIVSEMDQQRRLDLIVERAATIVGGAAGCLALRNPTTGSLEIRAAYGYPTGLRGSMVPPETGVAHQVAAAGRALLVDGAIGCTGSLRRAPGAGTPRFGATIGVPVVARGNVLGALVIQAGAERAPLTADDVPLVQTIADLAAVALENGRILEAEQQRRQQLEAVRAVTAELSREFDLASLLDLILAQAGDLVRCEAGAVLLWDDVQEALVPRAWRGDGEGGDGRRVALGEGAAGLAAARRSGVIVQDRPRAAAATPTDGERHQPSTAMAVPILYQERLIGVLTARRSGGTVPFGRADQELLELFASQAAIAIENARLFEHVTSAEALRELAQLKAELLNSMSHELRTPLAVIHGYAELLVHRANQLGPSQVAQMSGEIYAGSRTMARLVDDLLDFARLDRGQLQLRRERVSVTELLDGLIRAAAVHPGGERLTPHLEAGLTVCADPARLQQVAGNLISNALAYSADGPIDVRARRRGDRVLVEVEDRGPGLSPEDAARVWESFYRGTEAAHHPNRGNGLGLTVVKKLVELHGGEAGVRSAPSNGATFWFSLPAI